MLSVLLRCTTSDYPFGIFLLLAIVFSGLRYKDSDYPFGIILLLAIVFCSSSMYAFTPLVSSYFWPLCFLLFDVRLLLTTRFVPILYLPTFVCSSLSVVYGIVFLFFDVRLLTTPLVSSYFWPLRCLFFDVRLLSTHFVSSYFYPLSSLSMYGF